MVKHIQTIRRQCHISVPPDVRGYRNVTQPTNCLSVFHHCVGLALKGLRSKLFAALTREDASYFETSLI